MKTWEELESALLATFPEIHFELSNYDKRKGHMKNTDNIHVFCVKALKRMIKQFES